MSVSRMKNGTFKVRWWQGQVKRSKTFRDPKLARRFDRQMLRENADRRAAVRRGDLPIAHASVSIADALRRFAAAHMEEWSDGTRQAYYYSSQRLLRVSETAGLVLDDLTPERVALIRTALLRQQRESYAQKYGVSVADARRLCVGEEAVAKSMNVLRGLVRFGRPSGWMTASNPFEATTTKAKAHVRRHPNNIDALSPVTIEVIASLIGASGHISAEASRIVVYLIGYGTLRPGMEVRAARWTDYKGETLSVHGHMSGDDLREYPKLGTRRREVALVPPLRQELDHWRLAHPPRDPWAPMLARADGGPWTDSDFRNWRSRAWRPVIDEIVGAFDSVAGGEDCPRRWYVESITPEEVAVSEPTTGRCVLRHCAASLLLAGGIPPREVARQLGHDLVTLDDVYGHLIARYARKFAQPIDVDDEIAKARAAVASARVDSEPPPAAAPSEQSGETETVNDPDGRTVAA